MHIDTDTLITVAFVAVIIAFQLFGSVAGRLLKQNRTAPGKPANKEGLLTRINREIKLAMEEAAAKQRGDSREEAPPDRVREEALADKGRPEKKAAPVIRRPAPGQTPSTRPAVKRAAVKAAPSVARPDVKKKEKSAAASAAAEDKALISEIRQGILESAAVAAVEKPGAGHAITVEDSHASAGIESGPGYEAGDLQRAVVWSEILAPPVALRDL